MNSFPLDEQQFEALASADAPETSPERAPARLKARAYSALVRRQQASGPLLSIEETKAEGRGVCVFEELVRVSPVGESAKSFNCCSICHARWLAEKIEKAPIYWGACPYVAFQNR